MIKILLVDDDSSFRLGLRIWLDKTAEWTIVAEASSKTAALSALGSTSIDLIILELAIPEGLEFCQVAKQTYSSIPVFLLTRLQEPLQLESAITLGVEGFCPKGTEASLLNHALRRVSTGGVYHWRTPRQPSNAWELTRLYMRDRSLSEIDLTLFALAQKLKTRGISRLEAWVLKGRKRELKASRWLMERLWFVEQSSEVVFASLPGRATLPLEVRLKQSFLQKIHQGLDNLGDHPIELDILLPEKKQELLYLSQSAFEEILEQLKSSQVTLEQLLPQVREILVHLWERLAEKFLGKYATLLQADGSQNSILKTLEADRCTIQAALLDRIPLFAELCSALLFHTSLPVDHALWEIHSPQAQGYAQDLYDHLLLQVSNAVLQPLLNHFAEHEAIKQRFFSPQYRSTREIERFRNDLSWKYRYRHWVGEPRDIFESKYELLILERGGIDRTYLSGCRNHELRALQGWRLFLTLALEFQDALAPRIRTLANWVGRVIVFLLTEIIGRGIGLIGQGILRGIGYAWQPEGKVRRPHS